MKLFYFLFPLIAATLSLLAIKGCTSDGSPRVLIITKSEFTAPESTSAGAGALEKICDENGWKATVSDDPEEILTEKKIWQYAAIVFINTAGDIMNPDQQVLFERYIKAGGGFVGIHTAPDTEHDWKWYGDLVGARFDGVGYIQEAVLNVLDRSHSSTAHLDSIWRRSDEWPNLTALSPDIKLLISADESSFIDGKMGSVHPISWYHEFDGGRAFVTVMGKASSAYSEPAFLQHIQGGLQYAVGENKPLTPPGISAPKEEVSADSGFVKTTLACNLYEPMGMDILPGGKVLIAERRGDLKLFDPANNEIKVAGHFEVFVKNEEGLLGIAIDPQWEQNKWIYLFYSPLRGTSSIRLSRFEFSDDSLRYATEKVMLEVKTDRATHNYHVAGKLLFDEEGFLWLSTGDNTDHYPDGFTPINERPGQSQFDAQKSASNSMDLNGKILRIKPLPDGSYICPAGNMFAEEDLRMENGKPVAGVKNFLGRPEIFVMGVRNPFRFGFDSRRKLLMWGEPGPNANLPDSTRGPDGLDEFNWTRTPGFFGWPYFMGKNEPFRDYDFAAEKSGPWFDPEHPRNDSPNNTGMKDLPPARPAQISYTFRSSAEFPLFANGAKCAMGGPVYYTDKYPEETRYPDRFNGKFFIYNFMRNWVLLMEIDSLDRLAGIEQFAPSLRFSRPIDMMIGKNGLLYVLEYGNIWFGHNPDACLSVIHYVPGKSGELPGSGIKKTTPLFHVLSSPFAPYADISFPNVVNGPVQYDLIDYEGRLLYSGKTELNGVSGFRADFPGFPFGVYSLRVQVGRQEAQTVRLLKI